MQTIFVDGYWIDTGEKFFNLMCDAGSWDGIESERDRDVFFYFDGEEPIGIHVDFVITNVY